MLIDRWGLWLRHDAKLEGLMPEEPDRATRIGRIYGGGVIAVGFLSAMLLIVWVPAFFVTGAG